MFYIIILTWWLQSHFLRLLSILMFVIKVPKTLTFETNLISFSIETGVYPKPIAIEWPSHQYATSPKVTISLAFLSSLMPRLVVSKYISSPQVFIWALNELNFANLSAVWELLRLSLISKLSNLRSIDNDK